MKKGYIYRNNLPDSQRTNKILLLTAILLAAAVLIGIWLVSCGIVSIPCPNTEHESIR
jgi:hypothetical protein